MADLRGKVALVTGASSGIGRAVALRLASDGAKVVACDLSEVANKGGYEPDADKATVDIINAKGEDAIFVKCDVSNKVQVQNTFKAALDKYDHLDIVCNIAGNARCSAKVHERTDEDFEAIMKVTFVGTWYCCQEASRIMLAQGTGGKIVNTSSIAAFRGCGGQPAYCAAKAAVAGLTREMAVDYGPYGINVNAVAPGWIRTSMQRFNRQEEREAAYIADTPSGRLGETADIANAVAFLVSSDADYVNGHELVIDGGNTIVWDSYSKLDTKY